MKYTMQSWNACADVWIITDQGGAIVFQGSARECEDWLDRQENADAS